MSNDTGNAGGLPRHLKLTGLILLTVSAITPASSMFIELPGAINAAGTGIGFALLVASVIGFVMAMVYSELSSAFPSCGGEYVMTQKVLGTPLAYIVFALNIGVMFLIPAVLGVGAGDYFHIVFPEIPRILIAFLVIGISTLFGVLNIKLNAFVTSIFLGIEFICIIYFMIVSGTHIVQPASILYSTPFQAVAGNGLAAASMPLIATCIATAIFAFNGYEQAVYLAENTEAARRRLPKAILISLFIGLALEAIPTVLLILSSPNLKRTLSSASPYLDFINATVGPRAQTLMAIGISVAVLNACIVNILMTARFIFASGRDGFWGVRVGGWLGHIWPHQLTPWAATLAVGVFGLAACGLPLPLLTVLTGTGLVFVYFILCICVLVGRASKSTQSATFKPAINPVLAAVGMVALAGVAINNWLDPAIGRPSVWAALAEAAIGIGFYLLGRFVFGHSVDPGIPDEAQL